MNFAFESIGRLLADGLEEMTWGQYAEVEIDQDRIPLDINWDHYLDIERRGFYRSMSAREGDILAGYAGFFVHRHRRHKGTLFAVCDEIYLLQEYRKGRNGVAFIRECERLLKEVGVVKMEMGAKEHVKLGSGGTLGDLLLQLGYRHSESVFTKIL